MRAGLGVRRGSTHQISGPTAGTASRAEGDAGRGAGSIGSRLKCGAANSGSCDAGSERGTRPSSFSGGGEEHSRGGALRRAARGSVGRCGGDSRAQEPRGTHGRAGVAWRNEVRFGRGAWSRVLAQVRVCCAWGGGGRGSLASRWESRG